MTPDTTSTDTTSTDTTSTDTGRSSSRTVWPCLAYTDARAAIRFLVEVLGFTESAVYGEGERVDHAELLWPHGGGVMLGSAGRDTALDQHANIGSVYLVVPDDTAADVLYERVVGSVEARNPELRATVTVEMRDEDYGSHGFTCRDPHGVYWSVGTYRP